MKYDKKGTLSSRKSYPTSMKRGFPCQGGPTKSYEGGPIYIMSYPISIEKGFPCQGGPIPSGPTQLSRWKSYRTSTKRALSSKSALLFFLLLLPGLGKTLTEELIQPHIQ
ncbi:hypothetical protein Fot_37419 [Forsythia ovata]|uniref:Uncharacterized protein n=1 Tax=Forsythia ovata TaxID=205694 RepID=A0ABD1RYY3_9LAMI